MNDNDKELVFRVASEAWEFEQVHRLNYRTFVEEIPQHAPNPEGRLVDRFHSENTYIVCLQGTTLVGMLAVRGSRPFSLDSKVPQLDQYLPAGRIPVEVRLLSVEKAFRRSSLFTQLFEYTVRHCLSEGYDLAVISGTTRQLRLYRHLGFVPFGPLVGTAEASYQPMYLTLEDFGRTMEKSAALRSVFSEIPVEHNELNFLPGPVLVAPQVREAFGRAPVSHRGKSFLTLMASLRADLCRLTGARDVQVLLGSGTLANEVVAAQLSLRSESGLIISNGEFGERLAGLARRAGLRFDWLQLRWGDSLDLEQAAHFMARLPRGAWVWMTHHETSTGVLNPLEPIKQLCAQQGLHLCVDCISSIGALPVNLNGVHLASCASGKGLGSYPGLCMVFHDYAPSSRSDRLPGYLDLGHWHAHDSVPHTHSSNLVHALASALSQAGSERMDRIASNAKWLRTRLREDGFTVLGQGAEASPAMITLVMGGSSGISSAELGDELEMRGFWLSYRSSYLLNNNWIQISLLGDPERSKLEKLLRVLGVVCGRRRSVADSVCGLEKTPLINS